MNACRSAHPPRVALFLEALRCQGFARLRVYGSSMRPWLRGGEVLEVRREVPEKIRRGDVAVYARGGGLFAHRVIGKGRREGRPVLFTKGDAFPEADAPVQAGEVLGRVACVVREGRQVPLDTLPQRALGSLLASVSAAARWWYPGARATKRFFRAVVG